MINDARARALAAGTALGAVTLILLHAWRGVENWNYSEGVYALTARLLLDGADLYGDVVGAQPPGVFVAGAAILALGDDIEWLRLAVGATQLAGGVLAAVAVWRLTQSAPATALTPVLVLLTPWAAREHGLLTPEPFAAPLLLGAALLATRPATTPVAGVLAALAVVFKLPFALATIAVVALSAAPGRAARWAAATGVVVLLAATVVFGAGLWQDTVLGQLRSGRRGIIDVAHIWAQAGWNLLPLLALALLVIPFRDRVRDPRLLRVLAGLAAGLLATLLTSIKVGTGLNILAPVEAALVPLAVTGVALALRAVAARDALRPRVVVAGVALAMILLAAQTASLLTAEQTSRPFLYPTSETGAWGRSGTEAEVALAVASARRCPSGVAFSGPPYIAYLADRRMPGGQPDGFLPLHSPAFADQRRAMEGDQPRCP